MTQAKAPSPVYATIRCTLSEFGHISICVYELFDMSGPSLVITCQTGGGGDCSKAYAWRHGISSSSSILGYRELAASMAVMKRIEANLNKMTAENCYARTFAEYAARVLIAAGVPVAYLRETPNANIPLGTPWTDMPALNPKKEKDALVAALMRMEQALVSRDQ